MAIKIKKKPFITRQEFLTLKAQIAKQFETKLAESACVKAITLGKTGLSVSVSLLQFEFRNNRLLKAHNYKINNVMEDQMQTVVMAFKEALKPFEERAKQP